LLVTLRAVPQLTLRVQQGVDMGRPSLLVASFDASSGVPAVRVGGKCVTVMTGHVLARRRGIKGTTQRSS
jgi:trans-2,3-dihydro-3-hydroxyanthranilate isomerase